MKTQHTPGPWEYMESSIVGPNIGSSEEKWLRPVIARFSSGVSLANLNLMLSAPELLEALIDLLHQAKLSEDEGGWDFEQARAAIAKATGSEVWPRKTKL